MKKNCYLVVFLILAFTQTTIFADTIDLNLFFKKTSKDQIIQLESEQKFKLKTLKQESNPIKLILIFETEASWQPKELEINEFGIIRIDLKTLKPSEYSLEIQLDGHQPPEFELKNTEGKFKIIFSNPPLIEVHSDETNIVDDVSVKIPLPSTTSNLTPKKKMESKVAINQEASNSPKTSPEINIIETIPNLETSTKNLTAITFVNLDETENYLLLAFSPKPNFSFTLKEDGHYEVLIPEFELIGEHLAQKFYAPQNSQGFLSVKTELVESETTKALLIKIMVEPYFQLTFIPIPEGIKIVPTASTTK